MMDKSLENAGMCVYFIRSTVGENSFSNYFVQLERPVSAKIIIHGSTDDAKH